MNPLRRAAWVGALLVLAAGGGRRTAIQMLVAVSALYVVCDVLGAMWPRARPFETSSTVEQLAAHSAGRSFPSRHVASALAMAALAGSAQRGLGRSMFIVGALLGASRVAAGLHYPSDILAGALLGRLTAWLISRAG
jgi:undecaprenyl-diphosphatase